MSSLTAPISSSPHCRVLSIDDSSRRLLASSDNGRDGVDTALIGTIAEYGASRLAEDEVIRLWPNLREDERLQIVNTDVSSGRFS